MYLSKISVVFLLLCLSVSSAISQQNAQQIASQASSTAAAANGANVLARGPGGVVVTINDVFSELQRAPEATRNSVMSKPDSVQQIASNLLVRRVLAIEAERDGLMKDPLVAATVAISADRALSDARLAKLDALLSLNDPLKAA
jgi:hypothetical protein